MPIIYPDSLNFTCIVGLSNHPHFTGKENRHSKREWPAHNSNKTMQCPQLPAHHHHRRHLHCLPPCQAQCKVLYANDPFQPMSSITRERQRFLLSLTARDTETKRGHLPCLSVVEPRCDFGQSDLNPCPAHPMSVISHHYPYHTFSLISLSQEFNSQLCVEADTSVTSLL